MNLKIDIPNAEVLKNEMYERNLKEATQRAMEQVVLDGVRDLIYNTESDEWSISKADKDGFAIVKGRDFELKIYADHFYQHITNRVILRMRGDA